MSSSTIGTDPAAIPVITCSLVAIVRHRRWRLFGLAFGPLRAVPVRITYHPESGFRHERLDGQPMGELDRHFRQQLEEAHIGLMREFRSQRDVSTRFLRRSISSAGERQTTTAVTRRSGTDRHSREEQIASGAQIAALREQRWREAMRSRSAALEPKPATAVVTPFLPGWSDASPGPPPRAPGVTTSSVFRCDKREATDRIARLRQPRPVEEGLFPEDAEPSKPQQDELTTRMARLRQRVGRPKTSSG